MQIICDTTFLDGRDRFEQGEKRTVQPTDTETSEQRAAREPAETRFVTR